MCIITEKIVKKIMGLDSDSDLFSFDKEDEDVKKDRNPWESRYLYLALECH